MGNRILRPLLTAALCLNGVVLIQPPAVLAAKESAPAAKAGSAGNSASLITEAMTLYNAGQYQEALEKCKKAAVMDPQNPTVHYLLGNVCVKINRLKDATAQYEYLLKLPAAKNSPEAEYAVKALEQIRDQQAQVEAPPAKNMRVSGSTHSAEDSIQEQVDILAREQKEKVAVKQRTLDDKVKQIQDDIKNQLYNMPRVGSRRMAAQEARQEAQEQVKQEGQKQIQKLKDDFKREVADLDQYYQGRITSITDHYHNMQQQSGGRSLSH